MSFTNRVIDKKIKNINKLFKQRNQNKKITYTINPFGKIVVFEESNNKIIITASTISKAVEKLERYNRTI